MVTKKILLARGFLFLFTGILSCGLKMVTITSVDEYSKERFNKENTLSQYLIPYIYSEDLDAHAEKFLKKYCPGALETPIPLPINEILKKMQLTIHYAPLPDKIFGQIYFNNATVTIYDKNKNFISTNVNEGTILVNPNVFLMRNIGSVNYTIIHECIHWDNHRNFFELQKLINPDRTSISCKAIENYKKIRSI